MHAAILITAAYLCGSVPTGVVAGRAVGVDVRRTGSGNIGATNVARTAGLRPAVLTLLGDLLKGLLPSLLARFTLANHWQIAAVGLAAFFGHVFSVFLRFSGGKGVATGCGVFIALAPLAAAASAAVFVITVAATRYVSVASLLAALALPAATATLGYPSALVTAAFVVALTVVVRHRSNLSRLRLGSEPRVDLWRLSA